MGRTAFVTITAKEYALLQRIVGAAICTTGLIPAMYAKETRTLRGNVEEYIDRYGKPEVQRVRV